MLASLLPGLRDVRTPLTVGYLYLLAGWLLFADHVPRERPLGDDFVTRLFDLVGIFGPAAAVAALSFMAYVLGALLTVSTDRGIGRLLLDRLNRRIGVDPRQTDRQLYELLGQAAERIEEKSNGLSPNERREVELEVTRAKRASAADLRVRLLVANQELYGEYDRLGAEAEFRLNLCPPLALLGATAAFYLHWSYAAVTLVLVASMAYQGAARRTEAISVLSRAVLSNVIEHPLQTLSKRWH